MRRVLVGFRLDPLVLDRVDALAASRELTRSRAVRLLLAYALRHMPEGWKP